MVGKHDRIVSLLVAQQMRIDTALTDDGWNAESKKMLGMMQMMKTIVSNQEYQMIMSDVTERM